MLETELNDSEPNGEERSGASSPEIDTAGADEAPAAKGRRRAARRPARSKASGTDAAPPDAAPAGLDVAPSGPDAAGPSAIRFASPAAGVPAATDTPAQGGEAGAAAPAATGAPAATFQPPQVIFQPPPEGETGDAGGRGRKAAAAGDDAPGADGQQPEPDEGEPDGQGRRRRRRGGRSRGQGADAEAGADAGEQAGTDGQAAAGKGGRAAAAANGESGTEDGGAQADDKDASSRRRRRRRRGSPQDADQAGPDDPPNTVVHVRPGRSADEPSGEVQPVRGSTRLEAKRQRRREGRDSGRRRPPIITESEFLARREAVDRIMVVRQRGERTQIGVLEDGVLVEHYVDKASHQSFVGNVYLGKVQNVLPSMEAAFVDIGKGRNAVLYAGEVNFDASGLEGESKRIESALKSGQAVLVQVTKDPVGHKGARLTSQVSLPGRYLVYVPGGSMMGISRKLPDKERTRLKQILKQVMPEGAGVIVRTAAEGASEEELAHDVSRLSAQWESIEAKAKSASAPELLYSEPDLTIRVIRDIFNEDFSKLVVSGDQGWDLVDEYVRYVAPHLADRLDHWQGDEDAFVHYRIDEQLTKALERKVWLPSGGSLVIDHTEAMTVVDVNTGKFTGQGGNLEETVTRNNLEAAEEIVRQLRLRDVGGIIVIDFIDMVLESNRELVLRRLLECLARDRTKHQVAEVTSLGLVQMTRKRVGSGLLEAFSETCECCNGRGVIVSLDLIDRPSGGRGRGDGRGAKENRQSRGGKNGKESGRRTAVPAAATGGDGDSGTATRDADPDEAGGDEAGGLVAHGAGAGGANGDGAGADGNRADGVGGRSSGGRRRRRAATREQGPPEPVSQPPAAPQDGPAPDGQEAGVQVPELLTPQAAEPGAAPAPVEAGSVAPGSMAAGSVEPQSAEPQSAEPQSAGLESAGPESAGLESAGPESAGPESAGPESAGPESAGPESAGPESAGPESAGPESAEPESAEPESAEPGSAGLASAEPRSAEPGSVGAGSVWAGSVGAGYVPPGSAESSAEESGAGESGAGESGAGQAAGQMPGAYGIGRAPDAPGLDGEADRAPAGDTTGGGTPAADPVPERPPA
jgi:ribonuclease E